MISNDLASRHDLVSRFTALAGPLPDLPRTLPRLRSLGTEQLGSVSRSLVEYEVREGEWAPAYLLVPAATAHGPVRPVLALHQTHPDGHDSAAGLADAPEYHYGLRLAEDGFAVIAPCYPLLGRHQPDLVGLGYASGVAKAITNNVRALDLLLALPYVQGPVAAVGHSLGGHTGLFTALVDTRIATVVTSCGFDSYADYMDGDLTGWTGPRYFPRLATQEIGFDFDEVIAAIAPRRVWVSAPVGDSNFGVESVRRVVARAGERFAELGVADRLVARYPDTEHTFSRPEYEAAVAFLRGV